MKLFYYITYEYHVLFILFTNMTKIATAVIVIIIFSISLQGKNFTAAYCKIEMQSTSAIKPF